MKIVTVHSPRKNYANAVITQDIFEYKKCKKEILAHCNFFYFINQLFLCLQKNVALLINPNLR